MAQVTQQEPGVLTLSLWDPPMLPLTCALLQVKAVGNCMGTSFHSPFSCQIITTRILPVAKKLSGWLGRQFSNCCGWGQRVSRGQKWDSLPNPAFTPCPAPSWPWHSTAESLVVPWTHGLSKEGVDHTTGWVIVRNSEDPGSQSPLMS